MARNTITQTGVLIINGQQVENTFNGLQRTVRQYERQLRNLTLVLKNILGFLIIYGK